MNFFGHAAVASWDTRGTAPGFVLGAMLPDFATMCRAALAEQPDPDVVAGVALHHATDAVFHRAPTVLTLFRHAGRLLTSRGVRRGPQMAAAHVGVEVILDSALAGAARHRDAYLAALACDAPIAWRDDGAARFATLRARLQTYGSPTETPVAVEVTRRIERTLAGRQLLAPNDEERFAIEEVMDTVAERVFALAHDVVSEVKAGLALRAARGG